MLRKAGCVGELGVIEKFSEMGVMERGGCDCEILRAGCDGELGVIESWV